MQGLATICSGRWVTSQLVPILQVTLAGNLAACVLPLTEACRMNRTCTVTPTLEPRLPVNLRLLQKGSGRQAVVSERKLWLQVTGARRNTAGARHVILYAEVMFTVMQYSSGRPRRHPSWQSSQPCKSSHANCSMEQLSRTHHPTRVVVGITLVTFVSFVSFVPQQSTSPQRSWCGRVPASLPASPRSIRLVFTKRRAFEEQDACVAARCSWPLTSTGVHCAS